MNGPVCALRRVDRLLLSTDGSEFSEAAIREAIALAKTCSSTIYAVSVAVTNREFMALAPELEERLENEVNEHLQEVKKKATQEGVACETIIHVGEEPYEFIVADAKEKKVDMIIMGSQGKKGFKKLMVGSVVGKVIGYAPCSVLVVPKSARMAFKSILLATDGSKYSDAAAVEAMSIAKRCGSSLRVVAVVPSEAAAQLDIVHSEMPHELIVDEELKAAEENVKRVKELAAKEELDVPGLILAGRPYEAIINTARENDIDLIVVGSHGRTGIDKLLMGSVAERVVVLSPCPVLIVKGG